MRYKILTREELKCCDSKFDIEGGSGISHAKAQTCPELVEGAAKSLYQSGSGRGQVQPSAISQAQTRTPFTNNQNVNALSPIMPGKRIIGTNVRANSGANTLDRPSVSQPSPPKPRR